MATTLRVKRVQSKLRANDHQHHHVNPLLVLAAADSSSSTLDSVEPEIRGEGRRFCFTPPISREALISVTSGHQSARADPLCSLSRTIRNPLHQISPCTSLACSYARIHVCGCLSLLLLLSYFETAAPAAHPLRQLVCPESNRLACRNLHLPIPMLWSPL